MDFGWDSCGSAIFRRRMGEPVGIEISAQKHELKEDEAGEPDGGRASQRGQQALGGYGFDEEEEKGRGKNRGAVECAGRRQCWTLECDSMRLYRMTQMTI